MEIKIILNSLGLILTIIGVLFISFNSPLFEEFIDGGTFDDDVDKNIKQIQKKNMRMKCGVCIVILGAVLQLISNFA